MTVWWVFHYAEVEAREAHGEGLGACFAIGNALRKPQIRQCLKQGSERLEAARTKWLRRMLICRDERKNMMGSLRFWRDDERFLTAQ